MYIFIIDTDDASAFSFNRELCASITGQYGDCGTGNDLTNSSDLLSEDRRWFKLHIGTNSQREGPSDIEQTPDKSCYNSTGIYFEKKPNPDMVARLIKRALVFAEKRPDLQRHSWYKEIKPFRITGFRMVERKIVETELSVYCLQK